MLARSIAAVLVAMSTLPAAAQQPAKLRAVASFSILADFVRNVGGDRIDVATLVGPDADAHAFAPTPAHARTVAEANLIFINGLGFEGWMTRLIKAAGGSANAVAMTAGVKPLKMEEQKHGHSHSAADPHAWQ